METQTQKPISKSEFGNPSGASRRSRMHGIRSPSQKEADLQILSAGLLRAKSLRDIAGDIERVSGYRISIGTLSKDARILEARWQKEAFRDMQALFAKEMAKLSLYEREAWQGWETSKAERVKTELSIADGAEAENGNGKRKRQRVLKETSAGDIAFLNLLLDLHRQRVRLMGMEPATKLVVGAAPLEGEGISLEEAERMVRAGYEAAHTVTVEALPAPPEA